MRTRILCILITLFTTHAVFAATFSDSNWLSLGTFPGADGTVYSSVVNSNATVVYVGGTFRVVGSAIANGVAKWDGSKWSGLGAGLGGTIRSITLDSAGNLYAA